VLDLLQTLPNVNGGMSTRNPPSPIRWAARA